MAIQEILRNSDSLSSREEERLEENTRAKRMSYKDKLASSMPRLLRKIFVSMIGRKMTQTTILSQKMMVISQETPSRRRTS